MSQAAVIPVEQPPIVPPILPAVFLATLLGACAGDTAAERAGTFAGDLIKSPAERCAEARAILADLGPDPELQHQMLAVLACLPS